jgi:hypothetical protein
MDVAESGIGPGGGEGGPPREGYSSVLDGDEGQGRPATLGDSDGDERSSPLDGGRREGCSSLDGDEATEYREVPRGDEGVPSPAGSPAASAANDAEDDDEYCLDPEARKFWKHMVEASNGMFKSIADARDALDERDWRDHEAAVRLARKADQTAARSVPARLGRVANRSYRQVNVKLGEADYEALKALAITRDLPPSTMARMLVRQALRETAGL